VRRLILSDIHANLEALEAVLAAAEGRYDDLWCLGDLVGYGPDPNAIVHWFLHSSALVIRGNHDKAAIHSDDLAWFNPIAQASARWTAEVLEERHLRWLDALPAGPLNAGAAQLVHGTPLDEDEYITDLDEAEPVLAAAAVPLIFFGHTHLQGAFERKARFTRALPAAGFTLHPDAFYLINPGAVGQPRDGDPRAAFAIWDDDSRTITLERAAYDIKTTQAKIRAAGLPEPLARRLQLGR
jgi:diadenosine tetraphosphatase ApaH/serine/threonine PP2A family protein phosphatase